jgi:hypothetical protein
MYFKRFLIWFCAFLSFGLGAVTLSGQQVAQKPTSSSKPAPKIFAEPVDRNAAQHRLEWFHNQRAYPRTSIPPGVRARAIQHAREMAARLSGVSEPAAAESASLVAFGPQWRAIGPQPISTATFSPSVTSGRVTALVVNPMNANVVYMGAAQGGVWKTVDGGTSGAPLWTPLTDTLPSLAMGAIAIDPSTCSTSGCLTIYAGTGEEDFSGDSYYGAGIFKSTDGGQTWTKLPGTITNVPSIGSFTGPFSATVGGARFSALLVDPSNSQIILAAVQIFLTVNGGASSGIYRSIDGGNNWILVQGGAAGIDIAIDPIHPGTVYATLGSPRGDAANGVYRSTDDGVTWSAVNGAAGSLIPKGTSAGRIALAFAPSNAGPGTLYVGIQDPSPGSNLNNLLGFFKSTDAGAHWTNLPNTPKYCNPQCWYDNVIRTQPSDNSGNTVYVGGSADAGGVQFATLYRSTDGGNSWVNVSAGTSGTPLMHTDVHALAFAADSSLLYVGNDGGVWVTGDLPTTGTAIPNWTSLNGTLQITQFYPSMSIHPSDPHIGFGGTQDNHTLALQNLNIWTPVACGDGGWTIIDPVVPSTVYTACTRSTLGKSVANGQISTFFDADVGIDTTDPVSFIAPFVMDPLNNQQLYFGTNRLWLTTDGANSWNAMTGDLTTGNGAFLTAIGVGPTIVGQRVIYAGGVDGTLQVSVPFSSGMPTFFAPLGLPNRSVAQIVIDPSYPSTRTAYVTYSGFSGVYDGVGGQVGHIFMTTSDGLGWVDVSCHALLCSAPGPNDLPNSPVNDLVVDPDDPLHDTLYAATDVGVFQTTDRGATWTPLNNGLPNVAVLSLRLHDPSRTLRAATHGRGVWDLALPPLTGTSAFRISSITPSSAGAGTGPVSLTVNGAGFTPQSQIQWNAAANGITTIASGAPTVLTATIPASLLAASGTASISVTDPFQANPTNSMVFTITGSQPTLAQIQPNNVQGGANATDLNLTLTGTQFIASAQVELDGSTSGVTTTFQSSTSLTAVISHTLLAFGGAHEITVVNPPPGGGPSGAQLLTVSISAPPANDNFANAIAINVVPFTNTVDNSSATTESADPTPPCVPNSTNPRTKTVWYAYSAGGNGPVTIDTIGSSYDTTLSVWTVSGGAGASLQFTNVACNDDIVRGTITQSRVTFTASTGITYYVMIAPFGPPESPDQQGGKTVINVTNSVVPSALSAAPILGIANAGTSTSFAITNTPQPGVNTTFTLTCSGLPTGAACGQASAGSGATATLTITTTAGGGLAPSPEISKSRPIVPAWRGISAALLIMATLTMMAARRRRRVLFPLVAFILMVLVSATGCGPINNGNGGGGGSSGTPAGTYAVAVTGNSGATTQTTTVILKVN